VGSSVVTPLAFTRAAVDPAYTKLDLMDKEAVAGFFQTHNVKGKPARRLSKPADDIAVIHCKLIFIYRADRKVQQNEDLM
jgi:sensor domain CHASE-containing protein